MNSFIFGFHPRGNSLEGYLASRGYEVWSVDLRGQGRAIRDHGSAEFGLEDLAVHDLGCAIAHVLRRTEAQTKTIDMLGCSLGAALALGHLAVERNAPVHSLVTVGGLVRWVDLHPLVRVAFSSPWLVERVRVSNSRQLARFALPALARIAPSILSAYLTPKSSDISRADLLVQTVEDPHPRVNADIARWIQSRDLILRGVNVSQAMGNMAHPLFCVVGKQDGIVPLRTARAVYDLMGSSRKTLHEVGDEVMPMAHADLFLAHGAEERVFEPIAAFLEAHKPSYD